MVTQQQGIKMQMIYYGVMVGGRITSVLSDKALAEALAFIGGAQCVVVKDRKPAPVN